MLTYLGALVFISSACLYGDRAAVDPVTATPSPQPSASQFVNSDELNLSEIRLVCADKALRPIWLDLLREPRLTSILFQSQLQPVYDCTDLLETTAIDLNDDGKMETVVRVRSLLVCSATDNCPMAVYGFFEDGTFNTSAGVFDFRKRRLLFTLGAMSFEMEKGSSNGYRDLMFRFNGSSYPDSLELYKFTGREYERRECYQQDKFTEKLTKDDCQADE